MNNERGMDTYNTEQTDLYNTSPEVSGDGIDLTTNVPTPPPMPEDVKRARAAKASFGSKGKLSFDDAYSKISNGMEDDIQKFLIHQEDLKKKETQVKFLNAMIESNKDKPITPQMAEAIRSVSAEQIRSGNEEEIRTAIERNFAREAANQSMVMNPRTAEQVQREGERGLKTVDALQTQIEKSQIVNTELERVKQTADQQGWVGWGVDLAKRFVPLYDWVKTQNAIKNTPGNQSLFPDLQGTNRIEQITYLYGLPPMEMAKVLRETTDKLARDNPQLAVDFIQSMATYSQTTSAIDNVFSVVDAVDIGVTGASITAAQLARRALKAGAKTNDIVETTKAIAKEASKPNPRPEDIVAASGALDQARDLQIPRIEALLRGSKTDVKAFEELATIMTPSIVDPKAIAKGSSHMSVTAAARIIENLEESSKNLLKVLTDPSGIARIQENTKAFHAMLDNETSKFINTLKIDPKQVVVSVERVIPSTDNVLNTNRVELKIARPSGAAFDSVEEATNFAEKAIGLPKGSFEVKPLGSNHIVSVTRNLDETAPNVRDLLIETVNKNPETAGGLFLNKLRSYDFAFSKSQQQSRKQATYAAQQVEALMEKATKALNEATQGRSGKVRYDRVERILEDNRSAAKYHNDIAELEQAWYKKYGEFPSEKDALVYFSAKQINDFDYLLRNVEVYSYKARQGIENWTTKIGDKEYSFEGKIVKALPKDMEDTYRVLVVDGKGEHKFVAPARAGQIARDKFYAKLDKEGYKIIQTFDPQSTGLHPLTKSPFPVNFVAVKNYQNSKLSLHQIPYKEGGHKVYAENFYVKSMESFDFQNKKYYKGDTTFSAHTSKKEAEEFVKTLEEARVKYLNNEEVKGVLAKIGVGFEDFTTYMKSTGGRDPFRVYAKGQTTPDIVDLRGQGIVNLTGSKYDMAAEMRTAFLGEKGEDIYTYHKGSSNNPVWKRENARFIDPMTTINRSMSQLTNNLAFQDYKLRSAEEFIQQYGHLLDVSQERLRATPRYFLENADRYWVKNADKAELAQAKLFNQGVKELVGVPSDVHAAWQYVKKAGVDWVYNRYGSKAADWLDESAIFKTRDPVTYARSAAFHMSLGMFNPIQFFLQLNTLGNIAAIKANDPKLAASAFRDAFTHWFTRHTDEDGIRKYMANSMGSKDFMEFHKEFMNSGFWQIRGGATYIDNVSETGVFQSKAGQFLDFATVFFRSAEQFNRSAAFSVAYRELRKDIPFGPITAEMRARMIQRADELTTNMSRASNAAVQNGFASIPLQFFSYQWRLMEQVWSSMKTGEKLTRGEAARMLGWNAMLYGIPTTVGMATMVLPAQEMLNEYAQKNGINLNANLFLETMSRGFIDPMFRFMTGNDWSVSERYAPGGIPTFKQLIDGEKGAAEVLLGVSGSVASTIIKQTTPLQYYLGSLFSNKDEKVELSYHDVLGAFQAISSVNNAVKLYAAYNLGVYETRSGRLLLKGPSGDDAWPVALGIQPKAVADLYARKDVLDDQRKAIQALTPFIAKEFQRAAMAEDPETRDMHFRRARAMVKMNGTLTPVQQAEVLRNVASKVPQAEVNDINRRWLQQSRTGAEYEGRLEMLRNN